MTSQRAKVLITGAAGFIGTALRARLAAADIPTVATTRTARDGCIGVAAMDQATDWSGLLTDVGCVVHLAARVHVMRDDAVDPLREYRRINVDATINLARQAAAAGVKRFVFLSSIKVNGEMTHPGAAFTADDMPAPVDHYGVSKLEAERELLALAAHSGLEVTIIRPPLVYGPGVKANFLNMMNWLDREIPLPFGAIHNRRTLLSVTNLADLIERCLYHPRAANQVLLAGDAEDLSTAELLRRTAAALGKRAVLLPVPVWVLQCGAALSGRRAWVERLCSSLQVDTGKTASLLGWRPAIGVDEGLREAAQHFLQAKSRASRPLA